VAASPTATCEAWEEVIQDAPEEIVQNWRQFVVEDLEREPLTAAEIETASEQGGEKLGDNPFVTYGTTLLLCAATESCAAFLQLGDGDTVTVTAAGEVGRPLPPDPRLIANETTSMSGDAAARNFRTGVQDLRLAPIDLILLSSDGYSNSFRDDVAFTQVGSDILQNLKTAGVEKVRQTLPAWLEEATTRGSGDDISAALLFRAPSDTAHRSQDASRRETEAG
jgi:serine/threonine protein phosphatase PrpC